jgi:hypothetical protein
LPIASAGQSPFGGGGSGPTGGTGSGSGSGDGSGDGGVAGGGTIGGGPGGHHGTAGGDAGSGPAGGGDGSGAGAGGDPSTVGGTDDSGTASGGWFATLGELLRGAGADPLTALIPGGGGNTLPTIAATIGSTAAVGVWMAFSLFGKRRRDEMPPAPEDVLRSAAASGIALVPSSGLVPEIADPELLMPRWRRPSLLQARKFDPEREYVPERQGITFAPDSGNGHERRVVRYATVRLLDRPDELMGLTVSDLAAGDEVELCEKSGLFWFVRTPDGRAGWLHRMTLGDVVERAGRADDGFGAALAARGLR